MGRDDDRRRPTLGIVPPPPGDSSDGHAVVLSKSTKVKGEVKAVVALAAAVAAGGFTAGGYINGLNNRIDRLEERQAHNATRSDLDSAANRIERNVTRVVKVHTRKLLVTCPREALRQRGGDVTCAAVPIGSDDE